IANLGHVQAVGLQGVAPLEIPILNGPGSGKADVQALSHHLDEWEFDRVEAPLRALAFEGLADEAYRPLLIAASAEPGFLGHALEGGVALEEILEMVVDFYGQWTVGEKEHTIIYLNAVLQTAKFLGTEEALLPLAIGLSKLPF